MKGAGGKGDAQPQWPCALAAQTVDGAPSTVCGGILCRAQPHRSGAAWSLQWVHVQVGVEGPSCGSAVRRRRSAVSTFRGFGHRPDRNPFAQTERHMVLDVFAPFLRLGVVPRSVLDPFGPAKKLKRSVPQPLPSVPRGGQKKARDTLLQCAKARQGPLTDKAVPRVSDWGAAVGIVFMFGPPKTSPGRQPLACPNCTYHPMDRCWLPQDDEMHNALRCVLFSCFAVVGQFAEAGWCPGLAWWLCAHPWAAQRVSVGKEQGGIESTRSLASFVSDNC